MKDLSMIIVVLMATMAAFVVSVRSQTEGAAIIAIDEPAERNMISRSGAKEEGGSSVRGRSVKAGKGRTVSASKRTTSAAKPSAAPKPWNGFVIGDKYTFMNFEVVSAEKPWYTREAKANGAKGLVQVDILIDADGSVIYAKGRTGNKLLHPEAERAALASKFNRPTFGGKPARAIGFLVYRFGPAESDD